MEYLNYINSENGSGGGIICANKTIYSWDQRSIGTQSWPVLRMVQRKLQSAKCKACKTVVSAKSERLKIHRQKCVSTYDKPSPAVDSQELSIGDSNAQTEDTSTIPTTPAKRKFTDGKKLCLNNFKT